MTVVLYCDDNEMQMSSQQYEGGTVYSQIPYSGTPHKRTSLKKGHFSIMGTLLCPQNMLSQYPLNEDTSLYRTLADNTPMIGGTLSKGQERK